MRLEGNLAKSKLHRSAKWKAANWLNVQLSVPHRLGFCFLLQTLQNYHEKHGSIPSDQWLAWKATKTNPLRICMTAGTCGLVTKALQKGSQQYIVAFLMLGRISPWDDWHKDWSRIPNWRVCIYYKIFTKWNPRGRFSTSLTWRERSLKETRWECNLNCQFARLWNESLLRSNVSSNGVRFSCSEGGNPCFLPDINPALLCGGQNQVCLFAPSNPGVPVNGSWLH